MKKTSKILLILCIAVSFSGCVTILNVQTLNKKAVYYMQKSDYDNAIARLVSINDLDPNYPEVHYNLGIAYTKKGDYKKALASLEKAVELKEDMTDAYYSLGVVNEELADRLIEDIDSTAEPLKKEEKTKELNKYVKSIFENYEKFIQLAPEGHEKEKIQGQIGYLKTKYKKYLIFEDIQENNKEHKTTEKEHTHNGHH